MIINVDIEPFLLWTVARLLIIFWSSGQAFMAENKPSLFGIKQSNRDFTQKEEWGKNKFNSAFPASLCCYLASRNLKAVYLKIDRGQIQHSEIEIQDIFKINADHPDIYFAFEAQYTPFQKFIIGELPRTDLVIEERSTGKCLSGLEIKLTALPDHTTCDLSEEKYGSEIVIRPDTIVYLACSIALALSHQAIGESIKDIKIEDWSDQTEVLNQIKPIIIALKRIANELTEQQTAFLLQPIWKTQGKSPRLGDYCLDVFVWSNASFLYFIASLVNQNEKKTARIDRPTRTAIWLYRMFLEIEIEGKFNHRKIFKELTYNAQNDKAFAVSGNSTNKYMQCPRLIKPIIAKSEIKKIILGGGQNLLSPERRFDAIVFNSPELFS